MENFHSAEQYGVDQNYKRGVYVGRYKISSISLVLWLLFLLIVMVASYIYISQQQHQQLNLELSSLTSSFKELSARQI